jgi:RHS repeat-associated protein
MPSPITYHSKLPSTNTGGYRYFFNGQEVDNEVFGKVASFGYEFRQYDSRLGRWWSVDPKWSEYPGVSPFVFCNGSPVMLMDPDGKTSYEVNGERRWINDGRDNITIHNVTRHQFNRLRRNFARDMDKYNRLHEKYKAHNGYTEKKDFGGFSIGYNNSILLPEIRCTYYAGKPYPSELARQKVSTVIQKLDEGGSGDAWEREFAKKMEPVAQGLALLHPCIGTYNNFSTIIFDKDIYGNEVSQTDKLVSFIGLFTGQASKAAQGTAKTTMKITERTTIIFSSSKIIYKGYTDNDHQQSAKQESQSAD